jgi:hypothetical protein
MAAVKVELDVEGLLAPPLPGDALGRGRAPAEMNAEVKSELQQVKVEIKTEVKPERKPPGERLAQRAPAVKRAPKLAKRVPDRGAAAAAAKRRRVGGAALSGGAFCRRSRPRVPPPPVAAVDDGRDRGVATSAAVGAQLAVGFASGPGPTGLHPYEAAWEAQLARLVAYKAAHGDCRVPDGWAEDPRLGNWVNKQRHYKRKLDRGEPSVGMTVERAARLTALGFVWDPGHDTSSAPHLDAKWEVQLARLAAYKAAHGDCSVPQGWAEDPQLGSWVNNQRHYKRRLDRGEPVYAMTAKRAARLTALGFVWDPGRKGPHNPSSATANAKWEAQLARLAAYKVAHGDCRVPQGWAEDPQLGSWVSQQRHYKRKLDRGEPSQGITAERAARLVALGFFSNPEKKQKQKQNQHDAKWEAQLARLAAYKAVHGDCSVLHSWAKDPGLGSWVMTQRHYKRKLDRGEPSHGMTAERVARLVALGFVWDQHEAEWETQLAWLTAYKVAHGDCNVPKGWAEDPRLGFWVNEQRHYKQRLDRGEPSYGMTAERAARLVALGFVWDQHEAE